MKKNLLLGLILAFSSLGATHAAPPRLPPNTNSADVPTRAHRPNIPNMPDAALSPGNADVGDGDSFGRSVNFLGYAVTDPFAVLADCNGVAADHCAVRDQTGGGVVTLIGTEAVIKLPARAAHSLLCFTLTPAGDALFNNTTDTTQETYGSVSAQWNIESEVLNDPTLINPDTGLPFNGSMHGAAILFNDTRALVAHTFEDVFPTGSRSCIAGHLSRRSLVALGLSDAQARDFFRKPITIRLGADVRGYLTDVYMSVGLRVYGD